MFTQVTWRPFALAVASCPHCAEPLVEHRTEIGLLYVCPKCTGRMVGLGVLRNAGAGREFLSDVWSEARREDAFHVLPCPHCGRMMSQLVVGPPGYRLVLDACCTCRAVWFDRQEIDAVPHEPPPAADEEPLAPKIREKLAIAEIEIANQMRRQAVQEGGGPPEGWMWVPVLLGLPVKTDAPDVRRAPWCTWIASGLMVVFMVGTLGNIKPLVHDWGFVPVDWYRHGGLTFVTSFLLHLGVLPALVNVYCLLIFGGNVEDDLGPALMGFLVISSHIGGIVLYAGLCSGSEVPLAGATAGVSGVLGYYMVRFPWSRVGVIPWWFCRRWRLGARPYTEMPAFVGLLVFIVVQWRLGLHPALVYQHAVLASHVGGLAIGLILGWAMRWARAVGVQRW